MNFPRPARVWRWFALLILVGWLVWRLAPTSFAGRQATTPQITAADFGQWSFIGPPNYLTSAFVGSIWTGRVTSVAVDPSNENHWLIGAAQGGVCGTRTMPARRGSRVPTANRASRSVRSRSRPRRRSWCTREPARRISSGGPTRARGCCDPMMPGPRGRSSTSLRSQVHQ